MNRKEFLDILEKCLSKLPDDEKNDAINYYRELFDDAGKENEQRIIDDLGSPEDIAGQILAENGIPLDTDSRHLPESPGKGSYNENNCGEPNERKPDIEPVKTYKTNNNTLLVIIILVLTFPFWSGIVFGILGVLIGIIAAVLALVVSLCAVSLSLIAGGIAAAFTEPLPFGIMLLGLGLMLAGISSVIIKPLVKASFKLLAWFINLMVNFVKRLIDNERSTL